METTQGKTDKYWRVEDRLVNRGLASNLAEWVRGLQARGRSYRYIADRIYSETGVPVSYQWIADHFPIDREPAEDTEPAKIA